MNDAPGNQQGCSGVIRIEVGRLTQGRQTHGTGGTLP
jgi:hypothetical protein